MKLPPRLLFASLTVAAIAVMGACRGGDSTPPAAAPASAPASVEASPSAVQTAQPGAGETVAGIAVRKWKVNAAATLKPGTILYIEKGCTRCDGPAESIEKVRALPDGKTEVSTVFKAPGDDQRYIHSTYISPDGGELWVTVCSRSYCGGAGQAAADAQVTFHHSKDGGATWEAAGARDGAASITAVTAIGPLMVENSLDGTSGKLTATYTILPNGPAGSGAMPISLPRGAASANYPQPGQMILWIGSDNHSLLRSDGSVVFQASLGGHESTGSGVYPLGSPTPDFSSLSVAWTHRDQAGTRPYQGFVQNGALKGVFTGLALNTSPYPGVWFDSAKAYGSVALDPTEVPGAGGAGARQSLSTIPVLIDYERAEITPLAIYGPLFSDAYRGRNLIRAAVIAP